MEFTKDRNKHENNLGIRRSKLKKHSTAEVDADAHPDPSMSRFGEKEKYPCTLPG